jgi:hypothetical protein
MSDEKNFNCPNCGNTVPSGDECWGVCSVCFALEGDEIRTQLATLTAQRDEALAQLAALKADECVYMAEPRGAFGLAEGWCATHDKGWVYCKAGQPRLIELLRDNVTELEEERDALQARADQLERVVRVLVEDGNYAIENFDQEHIDHFAPGDFDALRQLIESEPESAGREMEEE